jgi:hypothetical protein
MVFGSNVYKNRHYNEPVRWFFKKFGKIGRVKRDEGSPGNVGTDSE